MRRNDRTKSKMGDCYVATHDRGRVRQSAFLQPWVDETRKNAVPETLRQGERHRRDCCFPVFQQGAIYRGPADQRVRRIGLFRVEKFERII